MDNLQLANDLQKQADAIDQVIDLLENLGNEYDVVAISLHRLINVHVVLKAKIRKLRMGLQ